MSEMPHAFLVGGARTPVGRYGGALSSVRPDDLAALCIRSVVEDSGIDPSLVDEVILGNANGAGEENRNVARMAWLLNGYPDTVPGITVNRLCASGMSAITIASQMVKSGAADIVVAGGVESMSRVPMGSDGGAWAMDPATSLATDFVPQGVSADLIATREGFSRAELDRFAAQSHRRAAAAWQEGRFARSVVPVTDMNGMTVLDRDETIRPDSSVETLATLKPSFEALGREAGFDAVALEKYSSLAEIEHLHHPGNSSGIVDGAALTLIGSEEAGRRAGMSPRARIVSAAVVGSEPTIMLTGPTPACRKALEVAGMTAADIDLVEINEAFAAVPLLLMKEMGWTEEQTNVNGGAIAMGHPLGATGAMILGTLVDELERRDLRTGIATLCIGAGMGVATIVERV